MTGNPAVYRTLPTFLLEKQCADARQMLRQLYGAPIRNRESLILGIWLRQPNCLCGLAEFYGFKDALHKTCVGYRLMERFWGRGIASETVALMVKYLLEQTDIEIVTASTVVENRVSARVLEKNGFIRTASGVAEDWGYSGPTLADKWFL